MPLSNTSSTDDIVAALQEAMQRIETLEKANPLNNGTVDKGSITVKNGGDVIVQDGGHVIARNTGDPNSPRVILGWQDPSDMSWEGEFVPDPMLLFYKGTELLGFMSASEAGDTFLHSRVGLDLYVSDFADESEVSGLFMGTGGGEFGSGDALVNLFSANSIWIQAGIQGGESEEGNDGDIHLTCNSATGFVIAPPIYDNTTGGGANVNVNSLGTLRQSTSSLRYKQDVEDATIDIEAFLNLRPRSWRDKLEVQENADTEVRYVGFIAEEVAELGLTEFVVNNDEGQPNALSYDRFIIGAVQVMRRQQQEIDELRQMIEGG